MSSMASHKLRFVVPDGYRHLRHYYRISQCDRPGSLTGLSSESGTFNSAIEYTLNRRLAQMEGGYLGSHRRQARLVMSWLFRGGKALAVIRQVLASCA
jgi:hypothetical protein